MDCQICVVIMSYRSVTNKGSTAIKRFFAFSQKGSIQTAVVDRQVDWKQRLSNLLHVLEGKEKSIIELLKNNRTRILIDFFRKHSAVIVVMFTTMLVAAGNLNAKREGSGFLVGYFENAPTNAQKIERLVKSHAAANNLNSVPLAVASAPQGEDDLSALLGKDSSLDQNQMRFQVLTATVPPDAKALLDEGADVAVYEVQDGDTLSVIAEKFKVSTSTIKWANDISDADKIMPGDKIFVLPTTGVQHVCKSGDTIESIAKKYDADTERIIAFNELPADGDIKEGLELIIPDGRIEESRPTASPDSLLGRRNYYSSQVATGTTDTSRSPSMIDRNPKSGHRFPYGYCTWYVATRKYVPWGGNAGTWLYHAKAYGASTGKTPKVGSIMVTNESWYGHVAIVEKVSGDSVTVSEMNYAGFAKRSTRTLSAKSRVIKGFIY